MSHLRSSEGVTRIGPLPSPSSVPTGLVDGDFQAVLLDEALAFLASGNLNAARRVAEKAETLGGSWYSALLLARVAREIGEPNQSVSLLEVAEKRYLQLLATSNPEFKGMDKGRILARVEAKVASQADCCAVYWAEPQLSLIYGNLAAVLGAAGRYGEAERMGRLALRIFPKDDLSAVNLGYALLGLGRLPEAEEVLRLATSLNPQDPCAVTNLGSVRLVRGDGAEALALFQRALALDPKFSQAWSGVGEIAMSRKDWETAVDAFKKASAYGPRNASARNNLGISLGRLGRWQEAVASLREATTLEPGTEAHFVNLGFTFLDSRLGPAYVDQAKEALEQALARNPKSPLAILGLGHVYWKKKDVGKAVEEYRSFLTLAQEQGCCSAEQVWVWNRLNSLP